MIYERLFSKLYVVIWRSGIDGPPAPSLNILRVSSATKKEASEFLYGKSTFLFDVDNYHPVARQIYKGKTSGLRNAGIRLFHYRIPLLVYERPDAITDRLLRALTSNPQLERFEVFTGLNSASSGWRRLARLKSFGLLGKMKEITVHAQKQFEYDSSSDSDEDVQYRDHSIGHDPFCCAWSVLEQEFEETLGPDTQFEIESEVNFDEADGTGIYVFKATVRPNQPSAWLR